MEINSFEDIVKYSHQMKLSIPEVIIEYEKRKTGKTREQIIEGVRTVLKVMIESVRNGLSTEIRSFGGLLTGFAKKVYQSKICVLSPAFQRVISRAMAVSEICASMGKIAAAPTAGSAGVLASTITTLIDEHNIDEDKAIEGLLVASAIGLLIVKNASIAGAESGCMGETGSASAMSASAIVHIFGGDERQIESAASIALQNTMGLICDPVAGLVEIPCIFRNALGVVNAFLSAQIALAGVSSVIPLDEAIIAMKEVADLMSPNLKETSQGGLANTKTARKIQRKLFEQEF